MLLLVVLLVVSIIVLLDVLLVRMLLDVLPIGMLLVVMLLTMLLVMPLVASVVMLVVIELRLLIADVPDVVTTEEVELDVELLKIVEAGLGDSMLVVLFVVLLVKLLVVPVVMLVAIELNADILDIITTGEVGVDVELNRVVEKELDDGISVIDEVLVDSVAVVDVDIADTVSVVALEVIVVTLKVVLKEPVLIEGTEVVVVPIEELVEDGEVETPVSVVV